MREDSIRTFFPGVELSKMTLSGSLSPEDPDVMSFLVATDNHVGFNEKDPIRGQDSFQAYEEILQLAQTLNVDAILHGGDLFHDNRPSRRAMHSTLELMRHYCLGERPCQLELLSDPAVNFGGRFGTANWEDANYNVSMPVLGIHGNHDDPTGDNSLSAVDLLSVAGVFNYFGKCKDLDDLVIAPVLLKKGNTKLALYGLGNIRDERLHRQFTSQKVKMLRPEEEMDSWFNLMLFHQNRVPHGATGYIPEEFLDDFLDLVVWGHEHDCRIANGPEYCQIRDFYVCQPGSSVATSLGEGEAGTKYVAHILIKGSQLQVKAIPLKTPRPFVFEEVQLAALGEKIVSDQKALGRHLVSKVEELIERAKEEWHQRNVESDIAQCPLPLIRLRVDPGNLTSYAIINPQRFGQLFVDKVANPREILLHVRRRAVQANRAAVERPNLPNVSEEVEVARVEDLVAQFLNLQSLSLLPQNEFGDMVRVFVEKDDKDALDGFVRASIERISRNVSDRAQDIIGADGLKEQVTREKVMREEEWRRAHPSSSAVLLSSAPARPKDPNTMVSDLMDEEEVTQASETQMTTTSTRGRGRGRGRGGASRGRGAAKTSVPFTLECENLAPPVSPAKRTRSAAAKPAQLEFTMKPKSTVLTSANSVDEGEEATFAAFTQKQKPSAPTSSLTQSGWPPRRK